MPQRTRPVANLYTKHCTETLNLPLKIARRYLFARRSTNAINIITGIAVFGVAIGTAALILILSVFNGFEDLFLGLYNSFNPDVTVTPVKGKTFDVDSVMLEQIYQLEGVEAISQTLEEKAMFDYKDNKDIGLLKGVDEYYPTVTGIDSTIREGAYQLELEGTSLAVIGQGIRNKLGVDVDDPFSPLTIYWPKRKKTGIFDTRPFKSIQVQPAGTFLVQQDFENQYVLTSISLVRQLLNRPGACTALEIDLSPAYANSSTYDKIQELVGEEFVIKNRYEQEASFLRLMQVEKWLSFAIVGLMMLLMSQSWAGGGGFPASLPKHHLDPVGEVGGVAAVPVTEPRLEVPGFTDLEDDSLGQVTEVRAEAERTP